jgi:hypothetical protein
MISIQRWIGLLIIYSCLIRRAITICLKLCPTDHLRRVCALSCTWYHHTSSHMAGHRYVYWLPHQQARLYMVCVFTEGTSSSNPISQPFRRRHLISAYIHNSLQGMHFIEDSLVTGGPRKCNAHQILDKRTAQFPCYDRWGRAITVLIYSLGKCDPRDLPYMNSQSIIVSPFRTS